MATIKTAFGSLSLTRGSVWSILGLLIGLGFFAVSGTIAYRNIQTLRESDTAVRHTHSVLIALDELLSTAQDAETGQRGYLLTGTQAYLEPYNSAVAALAARMDSVVTLTQDNPAQQANVIGAVRVDAPVAGSISAEGMESVNQWPK